jgi:putative transposase
MARPLRVEFEGALYHVAARGDGHDLLFREDDDRASFLHALGRTVGRYGCVCHAYSLLGTHYHLVLETPRGNLSHAMQYLNGSYAQTFHRLHGTRGHVFGGRYVARVIERARHLLATCRYVDLNPVLAGLCVCPEDWRWSSFRATVGLCESPEFLTCDWVLAQFDEAPMRARRHYRRFVDAGLPVATRRAERAAGDVFLGSRDFARRHQRPRASAEIPRSQRAPIAGELSELFRRHGDDGMLLAYREYGFRLREIAAEVGLHYSTVSRRLAAIEAGRRVPAIRPPV